MGQRTIATAVAAQLAACAFGDYPQTRSRPAGVFRDPVHAARCNAYAPMADLGGAIITGALIIGSVVLIGGVASDDDGPAESREVREAAGLVIGVPSVAIFIPNVLGVRHGVRARRSCLAERAKPVPDERAVDFTASARTLAERGDCAGANRLAEEARLADARYYSLETAVDPDIKRCLDGDAKNTR